MNASGVGAFSSERVWGGACQGIFSLRIGGRTATGVAGCTGMIGRGGRCAKALLIDTPTHAKTTTVVLVTRVLLRPETADALNLVVGDSKEFNMAVTFPVANESSFEVSQVWSKV